MFKHYLILIFSTLTFISSDQSDFYNKDIYPKRKSIKGLQPFFQDPNLMMSNNVHGVVFNFVWYLYQPSKTTVCTTGQVKYDGYCYNVIKDIENQIKAYTDGGVVVTGIMYGPPEWARRPCDNAMQWFCAPTDEATKDYGRFVGFIAWYYNGENGHGRVADFVIHNEVNSAEWFNYGATVGNYDMDTWITIYANNFNAAYDYARKEQKQAKILISFDHCFEKTFDLFFYQDPARISVMTFIPKLVPKLNGREWRVAFHAYPATNTFGVNDLPYVTFGNIGVLAAWLRQAYPNYPYAHEIQLTENGINCLTKEMQEQQNTLLCQAFRNILGTPGIESFIYHGLKDDLEVELYGLALGLWEADLTPKKAWYTYAYANSQGISGYPSCGFEYLPYIELIRAFNGNGYHWTTTRMPPDGYVKEQSWKILREEEEGTIMIYECRNDLIGGKSSFVSFDIFCEGNLNMGPMGYVYKSRKSGTVPLYRCFMQVNGNHFVSNDSKCEGAAKNEILLGYVYPI